MTTEKTYTVNAVKLIETIGAEDHDLILDLLGIDLLTAEENITIACEWRCAAEGIWWELTAHQHNLSEVHAVRWTWADGAGVDDVEIFYHTGNYDQDLFDLTEYLHDIAGGVSSSGEVREVQ